MNRFAVTPIFALVAALSAFESQAMTLVPGNDYFSIQLASGNDGESLQKRAVQLAALPHVRVEKRSGSLVLRAGFWEKREEADAALVRVKAEYPHAYVRIGAYKPGLWLGAVAATPVAATVADSRVAAAPAGQARLVQLDSDSVNTPRKSTLQSQIGSLERRPERGYTAESGAQSNLLISPVRKNPEKKDVPLAPPVTAPLPQVKLPEPVVHIAENKPKIVPHVTQMATPVSVPVVSREEQERQAHESAWAGFVEAYGHADAAGAVARYGDALTLSVPRYQKAEQASLMGWAYFQLNNWTVAEHWFGLATKWQAGFEDAVYGLALTEFKQGKLEQARARLSGSRHPEALALSGEIAYQQALQAYQAQNYSAAMLRLDEAKQSGKWDAGARELAGWCEYHLGHFSAASSQFLSVYREHPSDNLAAGIVSSMTTPGDEALLEQLAAELGGPLKAAWSKSVANRYYDRKLFLVAHNASPDAKPGLQHIDAGYVLGAVARREKSGQSGTSLLNLDKTPVIAGSLYRNGVNQLLVQADRVVMDAGTSGTRVSGLEPYATWRHEGWLSWEAGAGSGPVAGDLSAPLHWHAALAQQTAAGNWRAALSARPVRDSVLSYGGMTDPASGKSWGAVTRTGLDISTYQQLGPYWSLNGSAFAAAYTGNGVADNHAYGVTLGLGYNLAKKLGWNGFDYFSAGVDASSTRFQRNLSQYTWGHGGYFSPQRYVSTGVVAQFMTVEGAGHIISGRVRAGVASKQEDGEAFYPVAPPPGSAAPGAAYAATTSQGGEYDMELVGVKRLAPRWQAGGGVAWRQATSYTDTVGMVFVRYLFEPRPAVYSSDLPLNLVRDQF